MKKMRRNQVVTGCILAHQHRGQERERESVAERRGEERGRGGAEDTCVVALFARGREGSKCSQQRATLAGTSDEGSPFKRGVEHEVPRLQQGWAAT